MQISEPCYESIKAASTFIYSLFTQNCRQKVYNRGLCVCAEWLDILKLTKTPLIYSVSYFNLGGRLEFCLGDKVHPWQGTRFRTGVMKLSQAMYPFISLIDEHGPLKFLITKSLWKITRMYLPISV